MVVCVAAGFAFDAAQALTHINGSSLKMRTSPVRAKKMEARP